jgi:uncharacterized protein
MRNNNYNILLDEIFAYGHPNVLGTHQKTLEITTENYLTSRGNCIIAINASKSVKDFSQELKKAILDEKKIEVLLQAGQYFESFQGHGSVDLELSNSISMVFRLSSFISDRTALINCTKNSADLNRNFIKFLQNPNHKLIMQFFLAKNQ